MCQTSPLPPPTSPPPSSPPTSPQPSSPPLHLLASSPPCSVTSSPLGSLALTPLSNSLAVSSPPLHPPSTRTNLKHGRSEEGYNRVPCKQQKISRFFAKLTKEEAAQQTIRRLVQSADAREEFVEKQEARNRKEETHHRVKNTHSQRNSRARKKTREILSGVRGTDGKKIKVINPALAILPPRPCTLIDKLETATPRETAAISSGKDNYPR